MVLRIQTKEGTRKRNVVSYAQQRKQAAHTALAALQGKRETGNKKKALHEFGGPYVEKGKAALFGPCMRLLSC